MKYKTVILGGLLSILISLNLVILSLVGVFGEEVQARTRNAMTITTLTTVTHTNSGTFTNTGAFVASSTAAFTDTVTLTGALDANLTSDFAGDAVFNEDVTLGGAADDKVVLGGYLDTIRAGTGGTPDVTPGDDDIYIEGTSEVDGAARFDGAVDINAATTLGPTFTGDGSMTMDLSAAAVFIAPTAAGCLANATAGAFCYNSSDDTFYGYGAATTPVVIMDMSP